jgi:hypothetical protein
MVYSNKMLVLLVTACLGSLVLGARMHSGQAQMSLGSVEQVQSGKSDNAEVDRAALGSQVQSNTGSLAGPCLPAVGSSRCPADSSGFVFSGNQLVCNCVGSVVFNVLYCKQNNTDYKVNATALPRCDAPTVPQLAMPCAATSGLRCPAGSAWIQYKDTVNVCFCESGSIVFGRLYCKQNNTDYEVKDNTMPNCSAEPAFVKDFPCRAAGRPCASDWIFAKSDQLVCNCIHSKYFLRNSAAAASPCPWTSKGSTS